MNDGLLLEVNDGGDLEQVADLSSYADGTHYWGCLINDMTIDGRGNAYIGAYGTGPEGRSTGIILVRPDGSALEVASGIDEEPDALASLPLGAMRPSIGLDAVA